MGKVLPGYIEDVKKVLGCEIASSELLKGFPVHLIIWSQINGFIMGLNHVLQILNMDSDELYTMYPELFPQDDESEVADAKCAEEG